ncbi:MAG: AAA family ATPase [Candidatus Hydrogenedentes bacterium]|nr:AAA family ATPase [Candidatus Hydrogenedentota bacterium]
MSWTLAITGKGGVGKSTLAAMAVRWLGEHGRGPVLAVDADPNTCLDALLGVKAHHTVGSVREDAKKIAQGGIGKQELLDLKIQESLIESDQFDLIAMGRSEGPGCYCYANNVLRGVLGRLAERYPTVVIDNEAGLENLSRRTVQVADVLVFVTDPSFRGLTTARRLYELALEMGITAGRMGVVLNRARDTECVDRARAVFAGTPVEVLGALPENSELGQRDEAGDPILGLPANNPVYVALNELMKRCVESAKVTVGAV